ncbi:YibE/F family protein [Clostridium aestuarii]|uniref:YibE/F family protein n=1 Tax=Clostridium aestuarii TaxID=338193 RepID=A0ABT4D485_9CLOT|nr:YibE/F family protein [Clostridium aestuarii]MCY6485060.1 YibE/F family protein [Clostridium aestuarii]
MFQKTKVTIFSFSIFVFMLIFNMNLAFADETNSSKSTEGIKATVLDTLTIDNAELEQSHGIKNQKVQILITSGSHKGEKLIIDNTIDTSMSENFSLSKGDNILISIEEKNGKITKAYMYQFDRGKYLLYLTLGFVILMILIGGIKGIKSVFTLALTIIIILKVLPTLLLKGYDPVTTSVLICIGIIVFTLLIVSGINRKTVSAIIGTSCGVAMAGLIALLMGNLTKLTGYGTEESQMLMYIPQNINFNYKGLLFAAILMGALGAIMDVSMSIASSMNEIDDSNPNISTASLMKAGMSVGKDIMGTMSNTLILAYIGASLQFVILLMAYNISFIEIINQNVIATEIVRALSGSIGLISSIPITIFVSGILRNRKARRRLEI